MEDRQGSARSQVKRAETDDDNNGFRGHDEINEETYDEEAAFQQAVKDSLKSVQGNNRTFSGHNGGSGSNSAKGVRESPKELIDPWLSELDTPRAEFSNRAKPRRVSFGRPSLEPVMLMSATSSIGGDQSYRARFASPRRHMQTSEPIEVIGSDDDETTMFNDGREDSNKRVIRQRPDRKGQNVVSPQLNGRRRLVTQTLWTDTLCTEKNNW